MGISELIIILVIVLIIFGAGKTAPNRRRSRQGTKGVQEGSA
jgi:Sec-independent protein translocase protein TatA